MAVKIRQNNSEIQKFEEANTPALPYTFQLIQMKQNAASFVQTEEIMLQNKKTNEEFSVHKTKKWYETIEIKRTTKKVKN